MASVTSIALLNGGLGTELENKGLVGQDDPLWSARLLRSAPSAIKDVHKSYLASGADIITTASYQARLTFICI
jgi:homocysteine S-methyltransferase